MVIRKCANRGTLLGYEGQSCAKQIGATMWREITGYEGYYEVNERGQVRSVDRYVTESTGANKGRRRFLRGKIMKLTETSSRDKSSGYLVVDLHKNGVSKIIPVHVLVAASFIPNTNNLPTVNHIDGNKHNNNVENLEWSSFADNNTHALLHHLREPRGVAVMQYTLEGIPIQKYCSVSEAARITGISRGMISHCVNGRAKSVSGYIFEKLSESQTTIPYGSTQEDELPAEAQRPYITEDIVCAVSNNG